jgi:hypothetical protein
VTGWVWRGDHLRYRPRVAAAVRSWWRFSNPALGVALFGVSFLPWFARKVDGSAVFPLKHQVDAWRGSTLWTFMVVLGLAAAALGWVATRHPGERSSLVTLTTAVFASALSASLWARQWWLIEHPPPMGPITTTVTVSLRGPAMAASDPYRIERNLLSTYASADGIGQRVWITGWSYTGLAVVALLIAGLIVQFTISVRQSRTD